MIFCLFFVLFFVLLGQPSSLEILFGSFSYSQELLLFYYSLKVIPLTKYYDNSICLTKLISKSLVFLKLLQQSDSGIVFNMTEVPRKFVEQWHKRILKGHVIFNDSAQFCQYFLSFNCQTLAS